jgi:SAM-dependent methyltransferase
MSVNPNPRDIVSLTSQAVGEVKHADALEATYRQERITHWNAVANSIGKRKSWGGAYHRRLAELYRFFVPQGLRVLEIGCAEGDLLAALNPSVGVGVDFSARMIDRASRKHPDMRFIQADAHSLSLDEEFDIIILSDLVNDLWDVRRVLHQVARISTPNTRLIINFYSHLWELPLRVAQALGLAKQNLLQNWLTVEDMTSLLALADFEVIRHRAEVLFPLPMPLLSGLANRYLVKLWPFNMAALTHVQVARPVRRGSPAKKEPRVSVVVPARNEAGNIANIFARVPELGAGTELIFVEGGSSDNTYEAIERSIAEHPERSCKLLRQTGTGKGDAVRLGFQHATGEVLMILDSDLTVAPEDLPVFLDVLTSGKADFANGTRLVYPMEKEAMRFFNLVGNKFFSLAFSWLLGQPLKDTLCGTKVVWKSHYEAIAANRNYFGDFDPFGDFDLLFGASKLNLKILDLPVRYRDRTYGATNIQRWTHGWLLLRMVMFAAKKIKFI